MNQFRHELLTSHRILSLILAILKVFLVRDEDDVKFKIFFVISSLLLLLSS